MNLSLLLSRAEGRFEALLLDFMRLLSGAGALFAASPVPEDPTEEGDCVRLVTS